MLMLALFTTSEKGEFLSCRFRVWGPESVYILLCLRVVSSNGCRVCCRFFVWIDECDRVVVIVLVVVFSNSSHSFFVPPISSYFRV